MSKIHKTFELLKRIGESVCNSYPFIAHFSMLTPRLNEIEYRSITKEMLTRVRKIYLKCFQEPDTIEINFVCV